MDNNQELYSKQITKAHLLSVSLGAILGSSLRFFTLSFIELAFQFYSILIINVIGSVIFAVVSQFENIIPKNLRLFILTGFCASFTTFSATIYYAHAYAQQAKTNFDLDMYLIALFGNFFMTLLFSVIAIKITNKLFKSTKEVK